MVEKIVGRALSDIYFAMKLVFPLSRMTHISILWNNLQDGFSPCQRNLQNCNPSYYWGIFLNVGQGHQTKPCRMDIHVLSALLSYCYSEMDFSARIDVNVDAGRKKSVTKMWISGHGIICLLLCQAYTNLNCDMFVSVECTFLYYIFLQFCQ